MKNRKKGCCDYICLIAQPAVMADPGNKVSDVCLNVFVLYVLIWVSGSVCVCVTATDCSHPSRLIKWENLQLCSCWAHSGLLVWLYLGAAGGLRGPTLPSSDLLTTGWREGWTDRLGREMAQITDGRFLHPNLSDVMVSTVTYLG